MRRVPLVLAILAALLTVGCSAPQPPEAALVADMRTGVLQTFAAMGLPEDQRPSGRALDDHVAMLAFQVDPQRVAAIRDGSHTDLLHQRAIGTLLARLRDERPGMAPPRLLVWLHGHFEGLTLEQKLVAHALARQLAREARLESQPGTRR